MGNRKKNNPAQTTPAKHGIVRCDGVGEKRKRLAQIDIGVPPARRVGPSPLNARSDIKRIHRRLHPCRQKGSSKYIMMFRGSLFCSISVVRQGMMVVVEASNGSAEQTSEQASQQGRQPASQQDQERELAHMMVAEVSNGSVQQTGQEASQQASQQASHQDQGRKFAQSVDSALIALDTLQRSHDERSCRPAVMAVQRVRTVLLLCHAMVGDAA